MRIALLSPPIESAPPQKYGGTERIVANLARGLARMGHDVTLFASGAPYVKGVVTLPPGEQLKSDRNEFDVVHNHTDCYSLGVEHAALPFLTTLHGRLDEGRMEMDTSSYPDSPFVSISNSQRSPQPFLDWVATVNYGLPLEDFTFQPRKGTYLAFLGSISPDKRPDLAIEIAKRAGVPLKIAAKIDVADREYYEAKVKPQVDGKFIEFVGEIGEHEKPAFLGGAQALLFPIEWPEPFGMVPLESWACGTPVLARPCDSVKELHLDGVTGFIRREVDDLVQCVKLTEKFDRRLCRQYVERFFSLQRMCEEYVDVYDRVIRNK